MQTFLIGAGVVLGLLIIVGMFSPDPKETQPAKGTQSAGERCKDRAVVVYSTSVHSETLIFYYRISHTAADPIKYAQFKVRVKDSVGEAVALTSSRVAHISPLRNDEFTFKVTGPIEQKKFTDREEIYIDLQQKQRIEELDITCTDIEYMNGRKITADEIHTQSKYEKDYFELNSYTGLK